jgi:hypothetical protein
MGKMGELGALASQALTQDFSTPSDALASATLDANQLKQYYVSAAKECVADAVMGSVWDTAAKVNPLSAAINTALETLATAGEVGQRLYELRYTASPVETGIVTVSSPFDSAPSVEAINPTTITGLDGNQLVQIEGTGFISGAQVHWELTDGTDKGTTLSSTVSPTAIGVEENFGNQTASWQVQIINPGGTVSNWLPFQVTASGTAPPPVPTNLSPGSSTSPGPTTSSATVTLSWSGTGGAAYEVAVKDVATGILVEDSVVSTTSFTTGHLSVGKIYLWNVDACFGTACSNFAPALCFQTPGTAPPPIPTALSPGTSTDTGFIVSTTTPTMQWSGSDATTYELAISQSPYGSGNLVYDNATISGSATSLVLPAGALVNGVKYRWNIQAINGSGQSGFSSDLYFTVNTN